MIIYNIFSFDLQWNDPKETHIDLSEHISSSNTILQIYPIKVFQIYNSFYYSIWFTALWGGDDLFFFGSSNNYNSWFNLINLDYVFSSIDGELRACDFLVLENNSIILFGIKTRAEIVNETWVTHHNLVMSLSNDRGVNWSPVLLINNTDLPSAFFGCYFNNGIKFWTIVNYANQNVEYVYIWAFNESTNTISQFYVYQHESFVNIYNRPVVYKDELTFLAHENNNYNLLSFNGSTWKHTSLFLADKSPYAFIISKSQLYLVYSSLDSAYFLGKLSFDTQKNAFVIKNSARIIAAGNWRSIWPLLNRSIPTLYILSPSDGIASVTKSVNWNTVIFTVLFSLFFIILWVFPSLKSFYWKEEVK